MSVCLSVSVCVCLSVCVYVYAHTCTSNHDCRLKTWVAVNSKKIATLTSFISFDLILFCSLLPFSVSEYTIQSVKAVDDQGACVAKRKARVLAAAVGEAFYAVRSTDCLQCVTAHYHYLLMTHPSYPLSVTSSHHLSYVLLGSFKSTEKGSSP